MLSSRGAEMLLVEEGCYRKKGGRRIQLYPRKSCQVVIGA